MKKLIPILIIALLLLNFAGCVKNKPNAESTTQNAESYQDNANDSQQDLVNDSDNSTQDQTDEAMEEVIDDVTESIEEEHVETLGEGSSAGGF